MRYIYSIIFSVLVVLVLTIPNNSSIAQDYACLPTCDPLDGRNFVFSGTGQNTLTNNRFVFGLSSPANADSIEIGVFDGEGGNNWDLGVSNIRIAVFADPMGDGTGLVLLGEWFGDGSAGENIGNPLPDNAWFNITIPNTNQSLSENGNYRYSVVTESIDPAPASLNSFRLRTDGSMILFPEQSFQFAAFSLGLESQAAIYPNLDEADLLDPGCFDGGLFVCFYNEPGCCLGGGLYDGTWSFFVEIEPDMDLLKFYDGDLDLGSTSFNADDVCVYDGVSADTDDANTPNEVPFFAVGTDAVPEGASLMPIPADNNFCFPLNERAPSPRYDFVSPLGDSYPNENPSGTEEWELFNLSTVGPPDPAVYDFVVADIPGGIWEIQIDGIDLANVDSLRFDGPVVAQDEDGDPVPFDPEDPMLVPTLNEWGLIGLTTILLVMSVYYLRRKRVYS